MAEETISETKIGGEISLIGFGVLPPMEMIVVKKIVGTYVKQLTERTEYKSLKLQLKVHDKGKSSLYEINAQANIGNDNVGANIEDWNLYQALSQIMEKIVAEAMRKSKKSKDIAEERIRDERKKAKKQEK